jgi:hypothetical protein
MVPGVVADLLSGSLGVVPCVGVSGSRSVVPPVLSSVLGLLGRAPFPVLVGCADGVDGAVRSGLPSERLRVFRAVGRGRGALAGRSLACVRAVAAAGGLWLSFPSGPCPAGLLPSAAGGSFCGSGSGSWASLAVAVGLGVPSLVLLPPGVCPPAGWGFQRLGSFACGSWWVSLPAGRQSALF